MMGNYSSRAVGINRFVGRSVATAAILSTSMHGQTRLTLSRQSSINLALGWTFSPGLDVSRKRPTSIGFMNRLDFSSDAATGVIGFDSSELRDVLPTEKGSHGSAKVVVPGRPQEGDEDLFEAHSFRDRLEATIAMCRAMCVSSLWVEIPMTRASLIEYGGMFDLGFRFHHALADRALLNLWLLNSECKIPEYATHNVGVGAIVVNSRDEILCVRELRKNYMPWKTPTGLSELGEQIDEAAIREVLEETGIETRFRSILGFRQSHGHAHGRSDLFFVCCLDPVEKLDHDGKPIIPEPVAQASEIEKAQWVPLAEYRNMITGENGHPMMSHFIEIFDKGRRIERKIVNSVIPGRKPNSIFFPSIGTDSDN